MMTALENSPCNETYLLVDSEIINHPLGFVIDSGGSLTKIIYRSKKDYKNGEPLKPSDKAILRLKSFTIEELKDLKNYIKNNVDICLKEEHKDIIWKHTGITSKSFMAELGKDLNYKYFLDSETTALTKALQAYEKIRLPFHPVCKETIEKSTALVKSFLYMINEWDKLGEESVFLEDEDKTVIEIKTQENEGPTPPLKQFFNDLLSTNDYQAWVDKYLPMPTTLKPPYLVLLVGSAGVLCSMDERYRFKMIDFTAASGKTMCGLAEQVIGNADFNNFIQLAQDGDSNKVDLRVEDLRKVHDDDNDWYSAFPAEFVIFELGKLSSNNVDGRNKDFSKADLAAGLLSLQLHTLCKILVSNIRISKIYDVYVCGSIFQFPHVRKVFERHFYSDSLLHSLENGHLFKLNFFDKPGYLVGLGVWMRNIEEEKKRNISKKK